MKNTLSVLALVAAMWLAQATVQAVPITIGDDPTASGDLNGWNAIMAISGSDTYTNNTSQTQLITTDSFNFYAQADRGRVTPFLVRVDDAAANSVDDFTILAIGTTRESSTDCDTGTNSFDFSDSVISFELGPGESIAPGQINASVDGTTNDSVIPFNAGSDVFLTGGGADGDAGDLLGGVGSSPTAGSSSLNFGRDYSFEISFDVETIPEPTTAFLAAAGMCGGLIMTRRRRA